MFLDAHEQNIVLHRQNNENMCLPHSKSWCVAKLQCRNPMHGFHWPSAACHLEIGSESLWAAASIRHRKRNFRFGQELYVSPAYNAPSARLDWTPWWQCLSFAVEIVAQSRRASAPADNVPYRECVEKRWPRLLARFAIQWKEVDQWKLQQKIACVKNEKCEILSKTFHSSHELECVVMSLDRWNSDGNNHDGSVRVCQCCTATGGRLSLFSSHSCSAASMFRPHGCALSVKMRM